MKTSFGPAYLREGVFHAVVAHHRGMTDSEERQLAYDIELVRAEASSGYLTREELDTDLRKILNRAE